MQKVDLTLQQTIFPSANFQLSQSVPDSNFKLSDLIPEFSNDQLGLFDRFGGLRRYFGSKTGEIRRELGLDAVLWFRFVEFGLGFLRRRFGGCREFSTRSFSELVFTRDGQGLFKVLHRCVATCLKFIIMLIISLVLYIDNLKLHTHLKTFLPA
jgi:hypothetical protein